MRPARSRLRHKSVRRHSLFEPLEDRRVLAATITVNSTLDTNARDSVITLREAISISNRTLGFASLSAAEKALVTGTPTNADTDTIQFAIPVTDAGHVYYKDDGIASSVTLANVTATTAASDASIADIDPDWAHSWFTFRPGSALPSTFDPVTIDGYTQGGATANTNAVGQGLNTILKIEINGENAGIVVGNLRIEQGSNTTIRGLALNRAIGSEINIDSIASDTVITGNFIGSDISGTRAFVQTPPASPPGYLRSSGIYGDGGGLTIGGITAAARNLISGNNLQNSVLISAIVLRNFRGSFVQGNIIGPDKTGTVVLGNAGSGILVESPGNVIGDTVLSATGGGNVISGNQSTSISLGSLNATNTLIKNNKLGTNPGGTTAVGTTGGIFIGNAASDNQILGNTIAFGTGIRLQGAGNGNLISQNSIFSNVGLGIDLGGDGATLNDVPAGPAAPDQDDGPNGLQNFPVFTNYTSSSGGFAQVEGLLESAPNTTFRIEFFGNAERDESNSAFAEGQTYLGYEDLTTDSNGHANFQIQFGFLAEEFPYMTATATDITSLGLSLRNNTSEFSPVAVLGGASFVVTNTGDSGPGSLREAITNANATPGTQTITFNIFPNDVRHFYYRNDGIAGQVSPDHIASTSAIEDSNIVDIDPDWAHSWFSVKPSSDLPKIVDTIVIDGYSQAGSSVNTLPALQALNTVLKIELDGEDATGDGLSIGIDLNNATELKDASGSTVKGLAINRFGGNGIELNTLDGGNTITGNYIGTDVSGSVALGNGANGVFISRESNTAIGGATPELRNLVSGNLSNGVRVLNSPGTAIVGELFGTDAALTRALLNGTKAVSIGVPPTSSLRGAHALQSLVDFNETIIDGIATGIAVGQNIRAAEIEATFEEDESPDAQNNGIIISRGFIMAFSDFPVGGESNLVQATSSIEFMQIDLDAPGVTPNDVGDTDRWQNFPVLNSATTIGGETSISGTLQSAPNTTFRLELYSQTFGVDFRGGEKYLGFVNATSNSSGNVTFHFDSPEEVPFGEFVTATATRLATGTLSPINTSEFSAGIAVGSAPGATQVTVLGAERGSDTKPRVTVLDAKTGTPISSFLAYESSFHGGVHVATGDLTGDGVPEIITVPGNGRTGLVKVFDLAGNELTGFQTTPYPSTFKGGVFVAVADVNGDGQLDLITTPDKGRSAEVRVYFNRFNSNHSDPFTSSPQRKFLALGDTYTGGVTVAAGDLTGDGKAEIVIGNRPGRSPIVRTFDLTKFTQASPLKLAPRLFEFAPFKSTDRGGLSVALGNLRNDARAEILVGNGTGGQIQLFNPDGTRFKTINAFTDSSKNAPIWVAAKDIDSDTGGDLYVEVLASQGVSGSSKRLKSFQPDATQIDNALQSEFDFRHGFFIA